MTTGSLIGFGAVFVLVVTTSSALITLAMSLWRRGLARRGAAVERRVAELAAALPIVLATVVVTILALSSILGADHCGVHDHHAHLCLEHGALWLEQGWVVAAVVAAGAVVVARAIVLGIGIVRGRAQVARLRRVSTLSPDGVRLVRSDRVFCFVAGIRRSTIFSSSAARTVLDAGEWDAMIAHERGHVAHRDLLRRLQLELMLLLAAPLAAITIRECWEVATERLRDADAVDVVGAPETVAGALVRMARHARERASSFAVASFTTTAAHVLATRVESLLAASPRGGQQARRLSHVAIVASLGVAAAALVFAEPLHHALETLLG